MLNPTSLPIPCPNPNCNNGWINEMADSNEICNQCFGGGKIKGKPGIDEMTQYHKRKAEKFMKKFGNIFGGESPHSPRPILCSFCREILNPAYVTGQMKCLRCNKPMCFNCSRGKSAIAELRLCPGCYNVEKNELL